MISFPSMRGKRTIGALSGLLLAGALGAGVGAAAVQSDVSANWAGYVASSPLDPVTGLPSSFSSVSGTWVQPKARCGTAAASSSTTSSAFWVGLGGNAESSQALEQLGTEADCTRAGTATYFAWYELVPSPSYKIHIAVTPGDRLSASVAVAGTQVTLKLADLTSGTSFSHVFTKNAPDTGSAEWIAEAPSLCNGNDCRQTALTDFGKVAFSKVSASVGSHVGTIVDPSWTTTALQLVAGGDGGRYARFAAENTPAQATPSGLGASNASFTVTWSLARSPGGFGGGGYGGGGYPGGGDGGGYGNGGF